MTLFDTVMAIIVNSASQCQGMSDNFSALSRSGHLDFYHSILLNIFVHIGSAVSILMLMSGDAKHIWPVKDAGSAILFQRKLYNVLPVV